MRHGGEVLGDGVVAGVVGEGVGDAEEVAHRVLVEAAKLERPVVAELALELERSEVGDEVGAGAGLTVAEPRRINRLRQEGGGPAAAGRAVIDDRARQPCDVGVVVEVVQLQDVPGVEMIVRREADEAPMGVTVGGVALSIALHEVQPVAELAVRPQTPANFHVLGEDAVGVEALGELQQGPIGRPLQLIVEDARRGLGTIERAGQAVQHLHAVQNLAWGRRGPHDVEAVHAGVLGDRALEAAGLRPRHLKPLLIAHLYRRQIAQGVVHGLGLQVQDQVARHDGD